MESALSPREIQTRIRSGESVDDLARSAGMERDRVERFAAPVIAEREHVAGLAMTSSARRRGETSSSRTLRGVLSERLPTRGVDVAAVRWDSYRLDDGRWAVTADYLSGESARQALFFFDLPGRYSVAGNDEGRWVLGDTSAGRGTPTGPGAGEPEDTEPTVDLSDELALVRAIQDVPMSGASDASDPASGIDGAEVEITETEVRIAEVVQFSRTSEPQPPAQQLDLDTELAEVEAELDRLEAEERSGSGLEALYDIFADQDPQAATPGPEQAVPDVEASAEGPTDPEAAEPTVEVDRGAEEEPEAGGSLTDSTPSDASAVPELRMPLLSDAWEPAIVVNYPVEPSTEDGDGFEVPEGSDEPGRPEAAVAREDRRDEADAAFALADESLVDRDLVESLDEPSAALDAEAADEPVDQPVDEHGAGPGAEEAATLETADTPSDETATADTATAETAQDEPEDDALPIDLPEQPTPPPAPKPAARRKRASVPSWDEIVFGGPKDK